MEKPFPYKEVGDKYVAVKFPFKVKVRYFKRTANGVLRFPVYIGYVK